MVSPPGRQELSAAEGQGSLFHLGAALLQQERGLAQRTAWLQFPWALMLTPSQPSLFNPKQIHESGTSLFFSRQTRNIPHKLNKIQGDAVAESRQCRDGKASSKEQSCSSRHRISLKAGGTAGARHVEDLMLLLGTKCSLCYHIPQTPLRVLQPLGSNGRGGPSGNQ